jgi:predicted acylesterase/phospholipase RssA
MMAFWNAIADDPPVSTSPVFFASAFDTIVRLGVEEAVRALLSTAPWRSFLQRARNHFPPQRGSVAALITEYLLTARFELVSKLLEGIRVGYLADTARMRERLVDFFGGEVVPNNAGVCLAINTVDARTGAVVRFVNTDAPGTRGPDYVIVDDITVDHVLASASIPLLFPPVAIGSHLLWDGGLLVNTPLAPVVAMGAEQIVTMLVTENPDPDVDPGAHFGRAVERTIDSLLENAYNVDRKLMLERNRLAHAGKGRYREVQLFEAIRPAREGRFDAGSYLYFERGKLQEIREAGWLAAAEWLGAGPRVDHLDEVATAAA